MPKASLNRPTRAFGVTFGVTIGLCLGIMSAPAALAGECPADKTGADFVKTGPDKPDKVTDDVIAHVDLGDGYQIPGKTMRMRKLVIQPGGIVPWHSHLERPANIYVVEGVVTEYRSTCSVPIVHKAGDVVAEHGNLSHWWKNNSRRKVVLISGDIVPTPAN